MVPAASAEEAPRIDAVAGLTDGATETGSARIETRTSGAVEQVEFRLTGPQTATWTERAHPYYFMGNFGTSVPG